MNETQIDLRDKKLAIYYSDRFECVDKILLVDKDEKLDHELSTPRGGSMPVICDLYEYENLEDSQTKEKIRTDITLIREDENCMEFLEADKWPELIEYLML